MDDAFYNRQISKANAGKLFETKLIVPRVIEFWRVKLRAAWSTHYSENFNFAVVQLLFFASFFLIAVKNDSYSLQWK